MIMVLYLGDSQATVSSLCFSVSWILRCRRRLLTTENRRPHDVTGHLCGFFLCSRPILVKANNLATRRWLADCELTSPVWLYMWVVNELGRVNRFEHTAHLYRLRAVELALVLKLDIRLAPGHCLLSKMVGLGTWATIESLGGGRISGRWLGLGVVVGTVCSFSEPMYLW